MGESVVKIGVSQEREGKEYGFRTIIRKYFSNQYIGKPFTTNNAISTCT
jgi:hypothetical protein